MNEILEMLQRENNLARPTGDEFTAFVRELRHWSSEELVRLYHLINGELAFRVTFPDAPLKDFFRMLRAKDEWKENRIDVANAHVAYLLNETD